MWKLIKLLFWGLVIGFVVMSVTGKKIDGKTPVEYVQSLFSDPKLKSSFRDLRLLVGEALKALGAEISDEVTPAEREQLNDLVRQELQKGIPVPQQPVQGSPNQMPLPPVKK